MYINFLYYAETISITTLIILLPSKSCRFFNIHIMIRKNIHSSFTSHCATS